MRPDRLISYPPRLWKVDVVCVSGTPLAVCRTCGPLTGTRSPDQSLRSAVLRHLARHAHRDVTPAHLRTCQCSRRGCPWHRRHRGCTGAVVLALTHYARSPTWQLADACNRCCAAMPHTAAVPVTPPTLRSTPPTTAASEEWTLPSEDSDDGQVWETPDTDW